ncbi:MAG: hypothetical protein AABY33_01580 [Pseudomonadota bacterium]
MQQSSKTINPDAQIEIKLRELLSLISTNANGGQNKARLARLGSNDIMIGFYNDENGKSATVKFLNKLKVGYFIDDHNLKKTEDEINNPSIPAQILSQFLRITADNDNIAILFNHQSNYKSVNAGLDKAIESVKKDIEENKKLETTWRDSLSSDAEKVEFELGKKLVLAFPEATRQVTITYTATQTPEYKFHATVSIHNRNADMKNTTKLIKNLNSTFGNDGKVEILENDDPNRINFMVTGQPEKLLPHFEKSSFTNIFKSLLPSNHRY